MIKKEVLGYCKEKAKEGYRTHLMILDIYSDEEDIPEEVVDLVCYLPTPREPFVMVMGTEGYRIFNQALEDCWNSYQQTQHAEDSLNKVSKS